jgi:hypothetical protein
MTTHENTASIALDMALTGDRYKEVYEHWTNTTGVGAHDFFVFGVAKAGERVTEWEEATGNDFDLLEQSAQIADALLTAWGSIEKHNSEDTTRQDFVASIVDTVLEWEA